MVLNKKGGLKMELQVIEQREVLNQDFKIYGDLDNPLFLAKDVASWIEHNDLTRMVNLVDEEEKLKRTLYTSGQNRQMWFLTEDGLYEVLMQSRKPIAKQFKKEVKAILKSIRKEGAYLTPQKIEEVLLNPDSIIQLATNLKQAQEKNLLLEQKVAEYEPKLNYLDMILESKDTVTITQIAADYDMSSIAMNRLLNQLRVQHKVGKQWILFKKHMSQGYTKSETSNITKSDGTTKVVMNTKWTQKGRLFLYELLKSEEYLPQIDLEDIA